MPPLPQGPRPDGEIPGGEVGPELSGIGARHDRAYILESIVDPNKQIAQGFESVVLATSDGKVITGVLRGEDDKDVRLMTAEGKPLAVPKDTIEERKRGPSAMPADLAPEALQDRAARPHRVPRELEDAPEAVSRCHSVTTGAFGDFGRARLRPSRHRPSIPSVTPLGVVGRPAPHFADRTPLRLERRMIPEDNASASGFRSGRR